MTPSRPPTLVRCLVLALGGLSVAPLPSPAASASRRAAQHVGAGEPSPEIEFRSVVRGDGRERLSEYRGQPLILARYKAVFGGFEAARAALDLLDKFGRRGLVALLMEDDKEHDETYVEALALNELPGAACPLLRRQFLPYAWDKETGAPPVMALIGIDGTVLYAGSYQGLPRVKKLVEAELERAAEGWGASEAAREVRALAFGEGRLGAARRRLGELQSGDSASDGELGDVATELERRFASWKRAVAYLLGDGRPTEALASARALVAAADGYEPWVNEARAVLAPLETPEGQAARALEAQLDKVLRPLEKARPRKGLSKKLRRFADEAAHQALAKRARRIADAADYAVEEL